MRGCHLLFCLAMSDDVSCIRVKRTKIHDHSGFVDSLLCLIKDAAQSGGTNTSVQIAESLSTAKVRVSDPDRVSKSRFALAADDGSYLRQNIMPLQTAYDENDTDGAFSLGPSDSVEFVGESGRRGILDALEQELEADKKKVTMEFLSCLDHVSWLLSIKEVYTFVRGVFAQKGGSGDELTALDSFKNRVMIIDASKFKEIGPGPSSIDIKSSIITAVLMIFGRCSEFMVMQRKMGMGLSEQGMGIRELQVALNTLVAAGSLSKPTYDHDKEDIPELKEWSEKFNSGEFKRTGNDTRAAMAGPLSASLPGLEKGGRSADIGAISLTTKFDGEVDGEALTKILDFLKMKRKAWLAGFGRLKRDSIVQQIRDGTYINSNGIAPNPPQASTIPTVEVAEVKGVVYDMCNIGAVKTAPNSILNALSSGVAQLREDGGTAAILKNDSNIAVVERRRGISPFFQSDIGGGPRPLVRHGNEDDFWRKSLFGSNGSEAKLVTPDEIQKELNKRDLSKPNPDDRSIQRIDAMSDDVHALVYCLVRGLCSKPPPHFKQTHAEQENETFQYNIPGVNFPDVDQLETRSKSFEKKTRDEVEAEDCFIFNTRDRVDEYLLNDLVPPDDADIAMMDRAKEEKKSYYIEPAAFARWAPVMGMKDAGSVLIESKTNCAVAECVVYETLKDTLVYMEKQVSEGDHTQKNLIRGAAAAAKISQMEHMKTVFEAREFDTLTAPWVDVKNPTLTNRQRYIFLTRPVAICFDSDNKKRESVLYPCDAGLAQFSVTNDLTGWDNDCLKIGTTLVEEGAFTVYDIRFQKQRPAAQELYSGILRRFLNTNAKNTIPIYIANPPTLEDVEKTNFDKMVKGFQVDKKDSRLFCKSVSHSAILRYALSLAKKLKVMHAESERIRELKKSYTGFDSNSMAKTKRDVVWNDALREASISGDRLYAFVRQLSGVINETVDSVCMIDDGMLVQQQNKLRDRRNRISERAAAEHINLVKGVFTAVLRESGLTLGIGSSAQKGDIGELKVVSNTLRKQVSELAQGHGNEGFFGNSVRMEQLLSNGTGELTLVELFGKLQDVGKALQNAVAVATTEDQPYNGASMDFLSAPRNSMMLRYKPEALAAIRQAFEIFQREFAIRFGVMHVPISAYELMEGNDDSLSMHFATFCAHMLVHSRMFGSSTAMYVGQWPSAANAQQLKISLERLCKTAYAYRMTCSRPEFLTAGGRDAYFKRAASMQTKLFFTPW